MLKDKHRVMAHWLIIILGMLAMIAIHKHTDHQQPKTIRHHYKLEIPLEDGWVSFKTTIGGKTVTVIKHKDYITVEDRKHMHK